MGQFAVSASFKLEPDALIPSRRCLYTADEQALIHRASGIEASGPWLDPFLAFMGGVYAIGEAITGEFPNWGAVITGQNVSIKRRHPIDAPAFVQGRVTMLGADPRGHVIGFAVEAANAAGEPFADMLMTLLLLDPAALPERGERAARIVEPATPGGFENIGMVSFTPEAVRCFELNRPPSPHTDPDLARAAGFSKPIAAGNQVFSIIWNRLVEPKYTFPVQLAFTLKRPIFWDETVTFERRRGGAAGREILEVRNAAGKTSIICEISGAGSLE